ncbi:exocyst complex component EXO70B1 [Tripterygium wilfordii]|uniref:Exocyst subunit Exo70 family protein n=1 Tax=Tripterygium wilfordii TaxID=458696 RepID=A0A7J7DRJ1_TRIWF|nr:exocyst complex component EXO70E2-like [Tripterygium wilfordii]KAF5748927.1 exocyst complex component EXO70B1 [Tripterygium wilfordii]
MAMGDNNDSMVPGLEGEENLIAAAKHLVRALGSKKNLTDDEKKVLADLGKQLSTIATVNETAVNENKGEGINEIELQLNAVQEKITSWEVDESIIWDGGSTEGHEYLNAVDEARNLTERLDRLCEDKGDDENELLRRAHNVIQMAMARLEEEFRHILVEHRQPLEPEHLSFRSSEEDAADVGSINSFGDDSFEEPIHRDGVSRTSEEYIVDLVNPDVISDLSCIANSMFQSNYHHECSQVYISVRKDAFEEYLFILEMEKLSIEHLLKMEWRALNSKIKRWIRAMKIFVRLYLSREKWLSEQIFGDLGSLSSVCFVEASKASILQLLNFGEAVSIGPHKPEKLFPFLDMYELLLSLIPDIDALYSGEAGSCVRNEYDDVIKRLGDSVRAAFLEFENAIASSTSTNPFAGGGIHHLTRYVMNYIKTLTDYSETLNLLLDDCDRETFSPEMSPAKEEGKTSGGTSPNISPMALHFRSVASILECNLEEKAKLYKDPSLVHIFLMNNIYYMTQKVKDSELRHLFGDDWIRKHNWKFQQHEMNYERATWSSILALLKDEGNSSSGSISKTHLKERFRRFYLSFEEVYKTQTAWLIPDLQLREDLRISTSLKVIQAYRTFLGRHINHVSDKHIKYSADDLQNYLLDLFEGSPKSLHNSYRR